MRQATEYDLRDSAANPCACASAYAYGHAFRQVEAPRRGTDQEQGRPPVSAWLAAVNGSIVGAASNSLNNCVHSVTFSASLNPFPLWSRFVVEGRRRLLISRGRTA
jgi:hypothetical protein